MKPSARNEWRKLWERVIAFFSVKRGPKLYVTYTRRLQLLDQVRTLRKQSVTDAAKRAMSVRDRLNLSYK